MTDDELGRIEVPNTFKQPGESDEAWIDRITGAAHAPADPYATYGKRGECDKPALIGRAAVVEAWNDLPEEIRQCPDLATLLAALRDCDDAPASSEAVKWKCPDCGNGAEFNHRGCLLWKFECFIDFATGGKLSKSSWALETLKAAATEHINAIVESFATSEAVKGVSTAEQDAARYQFLRHADLDDMAAKYWPNGADVPEGEAFDAAVDAAMLAAPSHPPATPTVAVQAEPVAWLRDQRDTYEGRETLDPMWITGRANPGRGINGATYSPLFAHPKPAAPATADATDLVAQWMGEWDVVLPTKAYDALIAILALRSGASAQPAGGAA